MLPTSKRLNLKKDFKWVASGKRFNSVYFTLFVRMGDNKLPQVGIASSSKEFRKAYERNRARRILSSAFESIYSKLPETINIVALPKNSVLKVKSKDVLLELEEVFKKGKVISGKGKVEE